VTDSNKPDKLVSAADESVAAQKAWGKLLDAFGALAARQQLQKDAAAALARHIAPQVRSFRQVMGLTAPAASPLLNLLNNPLAEKVRNLEDEIQKLRHEVARKAKEADKHERDSQESQQKIAELTQTLSELNEQEQLRYLIDRVDQPAREHLF
jgi:predicted RNase H-like nuclease (RuvC/YqgF family)